MLRKYFPYDGRDYALLYIFHQNSLVLLPEWLRLPEEMSVESDGIFLFFHIAKPHH